MNAAPLSGAHVLVTRPANQADSLVAAIEAAGGIAHRLPVIDIVPETDETIRTGIEKLLPHDLAIFVSANAVNHGRLALERRPARVAAIGPATAAALGNAGIAVDIVPEGRFDSEHLLATDELNNVEGLTVTIIRGQDGREKLGDTLRDRGAKVQYLAVYRRQPRTLSAGERSEIEDLCQRDGIDAVIVMSVASMEALLAALPRSCAEALAKTRLVGPSERVIQTALGRLPGAQGVLAPGPDAEQLVGALIASLRRHPDPK